MTTPLDTSQYRPPYPAYWERGMEAAPYENGPPDLRPSGFGPGYSVYASAHGRNLAGMDNFDQNNSEGIETYPNELNLLAAADDINGNGVFDPHGSHGNIHPDTGIFQDHESIPGYVSRDDFYRLSEVVDLTQPGGRLAYVPGGAVSFQQGQERTFEDNQLLWQIPPGMGWQPKELREQSIVNAPTATWSVGQTDDAKRAQYYFAAAGAGVALGLVAVFFMRKKRR